VRIIFAILFSPAPAVKLPLNRHLGGELQSKPRDQIWAGVSLSGASSLAYQIVAVRENETVRCERDSVLIAIAKARVWTSEGWQVAITDEEGRTLEPADFDKLLAA
jgi:hypothetical protein